METSHLSYPASVAVIIALAAIVGPRIAKRLQRKDRDVESIIVIWGVVIVIGVNQIGGLPDLRRVQPMLTQVLASLAVILWGIVIFRMRSKLETVSGLIGAPNVRIVHGQNIKIPFKYPTISALSNAIEGSEEGIRALSKWETWRQEDLVLEPGGIEVRNLVLKKENNNTLKISMTLSNVTKDPITIYSLGFGWEKTPKSPPPDWCVVAFLVVHAGEYRIEAGSNADFAKCFELVRSMEENLPGESLVGFCFTRHGLVHKNWYNRVPAERDL